MPRSKLSPRLTLDDRLGTTPSTGTVNKVGVSSSYYFLSLALALAFLCILALHIGGGHGAQQP